MNKVLYQITCYIHPALCTTIGDAIDPYAFFHNIQAEYPHYVILATDDSEEGGAPVSLVVDEENSPDHQNI